MVALVGDRKCRRTVLYRQDCDLHPYVIVPNHVHVLLTPWVVPARLMQSIKGISAREANKILGVSGQAFWQHESYDRLVRSPEEFSKIKKYIENNPVRAGLAARPEDYRWSSAWWRKLSLRTALAGSALKRLCKLKLATPFLLTSDPSGSILGSDAY